MMISKLLHHAVEYTCTMIRDEESDSGENNGIDVIRSLASVGPKMLCKLDKHGGGGAHQYNPDGQI